MIDETICGLDPRVQQQLFTVFSQYPNIDQVILYGSRALSNFKSGSDIDLTLDGKHLTLQDLLSITTKIDELMLPYKVDLSILQQIDYKELLNHIKRVGIVFYRSNARRS